MSNPHNSLTALRCIDVLSCTETGNTEWKVNYLRDVIRTHLKHEVVKSQRRKPRIRSKP